MSLLTVMIMRVTMLGPRMRVIASMTWRMPNKCALIISYIYQLFNNDIIKVAFLKFGTLRYR